MNTEKLFRHPEIFALPKRGAFTPLECLAEWRETLEHALGRYPELAADHERIADIAPSARDLFAQSESDLAKLLPHLDTEDGAAEAHRINDLRDDLREFFDFDRLAAQVAHEREKLLATLREQLASARTLLERAGLPPYTPHQKAVAQEGCRTILHTVEQLQKNVPMDGVILDLLDSLVAVADAMCAISKDAQASEGVG